MTIPLMHYLQTISNDARVRHGLTIAMMLCALAALGSYSRGALLAIAAMGCFLWLKSQHKLRIGLLLLLAVPPAIAFMPDKWTERMDTINTLRGGWLRSGAFQCLVDGVQPGQGSAYFGGGFEVITPELFQRYAPNPDRPACCAQHLFSGAG